MVKDCSKFKSSSNVIAVSVSEKINEQISASNKKIVTFIKMVVGVCVCVRGGGGGGWVGGGGGGGGGCNASHLFPVPMSLT